MKKVLLALFLMFGFANSAAADTHTTNRVTVSIIAEDGGKQDDAVKELKLDVTQTGTKRYKIKVTNLSPNATLMFKNDSLKNIIMRFDAGSTSKDQAGATSKSQIVYQVGSQNNFSTSDYHAFSSCEVDNNTKDRPTGSFIIINAKQTKFLKFALRSCDTNEVNQDEKVNLETILSVVETELSDTSVDHTLPNTYGLPTVIIGQNVTRDLSTGIDESVCRTTRNNIKSLELYDGSNQKVESFSYNYQVGNVSQINFTIENKPGINYRKMRLKLTCSPQGEKGSTGQKIERLYYFDARPEKIVVKNLPKEDEWLYAEQKYGMDGNPDKNRFSEFIEKVKTHKDFFLLTNTEKKVFDEVGQEVFLSTNAGQNCENCEIKVIESKIESKKMKPITLTAVDATGKEIESYSSIAEIAITGKIFSDGSKGNIINEKSGNNLIRPCVAGSRANCEIALAEIKKDKTEIYTHIINNKKLLAYNNVGPTVLYGADTEWTKYSQTYKAPDSTPAPRQANQANQSTLCNKFESHSFGKRVNINGKDYNLVGCNIPFVPEGGKEGDEINFYSFKPAFYKLTFDNKNSPANDSYGTDKLTYIHTIDTKDYNAKNNEIFEAADFNPSILAIGATLESLRYNRALSHYDNNLKVAKKLKFSGNPANPTITIDGSEQNKIADNFNVTARNSKTDISDAIMLTLEPKKPYNHTEGYTGASESTDITTDKDSITLNMPANNFYAGKNIKVNKLNFKREDLLARSYAHIGKSSLNIDISDAKNTELNTKISKDQAAFIFSYKGDDLHFVDAAIIAPNVASNENTADGAVYLAGFCDPTTREACRESGLFISDTIAGHINYFGFRDIKGGATDSSLFTYDGATFAQFRRGADFLNSFNADEVKIELKGDKAREYCNIFRNCYPLGIRFGTTFNSYKARATQWHGDGDQGKNIVDSTARRKEQRLSF
ncbi:hypothetical protein [Campylobacter sp.]|uniref:hypothetical protein n=1 Tax=Campylobacter sp. TaxID=205 RepID=UPI002AA7394A|nr:hypothetical protein [Campylobacter sp.]MCI6565402.1 hypothetical protein [Campylobacter sp.]MCI6579050.1 hypothetical protein [Campylobacter sp.]